MSHKSEKDPNTKKQKMKAIDFSSTTELTVVDVAKPELAKDNELLVKVVSAAIDTALDPVSNNGPHAELLHTKKKDGEPFVLGWHYAGTIEEIGSGVEGFAVGDDVFGFLPYSAETFQGTLAEYVTVASDSCAKKPESVSFDLAAASATEVATALQGIRDQGKMKEGHRVLVLGGGGGVGIAGVQVAKLLGASHVTATCSTRDVDRVRSHGADTVVDRSKVSPTTIDEQFDVIFDSTGMYSAKDFMGKLRRGSGCYVTTLPDIGLLWGIMRAIVTLKNWPAFVLCVSKRPDMELIGDWLSSGKMKVAIDSTFKVKDISEAVKRQADRTKVGRVVINVADGWH